MSVAAIQGMTITAPRAVLADAYIQFFKNTGQMGLIVLLLVFSGSLVQELTRGTLINILSKGLKRSTVILSKYTAAMLLWTIIYCIAALTHIGYSLYLFPGEHLEHVFLSLFCLWLFGALLLLNLLPRAADINPLSLASRNTSLL